MPLSWETIIRAQLAADNQKMDMSDCINSDSTFKPEAVSAISEFIHKAEPPIGFPKIHEGLKDHLDIIFYTGEDCVCWFFELRYASPEYYKFARSQLRFMKSWCMFLKKIGYKIIPLR